MLRLVAELYYQRGHGQIEIAELTGFSVSKVSRLLAQARDTGIVRITVEPRTVDELTPDRGRARRPSRRRASTSRPGGRPTPTIAARLCGIAAAPFVASLLPTTGVVGVAGGYTVSALVARPCRAMDRPGLTSCR